MCKYASKFVHLLRSNKKTCGYVCKSFEVNKRWGMHFDAVILKFLSNESVSAKKIVQFLDYFFFYRSLKLVHLQLQLLSYTSHRQKKDYWPCVYKIGLMVKLVVFCCTYNYTGMTDDDKVLLFFRS